MLDKKISIISRAIRNDSEKHFQLLFQKTYKSVYKVCLDMGLTHENAEEVVHDAYVQLWNQRKMLNDSGEIVGLLKIITKRIIYKKLYPKKAIVFLSKDIEMCNKRELQESYENIQVNNEMLKKYINRLPKRQKEVLELIYLDGLTHKEVAEFINISIRTVENVVHSAKSNLSSLVWKEGLEMSDFIV